MSKKFLLFVALVFALLADKSIASDTNKPVEFEDTTSNTLVISHASEIFQEISLIDINDLSIYTMTHTLSFANATDLRVFALTSKGNYILAEKAYQVLCDTLPIDCFQPSLSSFLKVMMVEKLGEKLIHENYGMTTTNKILSDIYKICEEQSFPLHHSLKNEIEKNKTKEIRTNWTVYLDKNFPRLRDHITSLRQHSRTCSNITNKTEDHAVIDYIFSLHLLEKSSNVIEQHYLKKSIEILTSELSVRFGTENLDLYIDDKFQIVRYDQHSDKKM